MPHRGNKLVEACSDKVRYNKVTYMLEDLTKKITSVFHPQKIILFGSNAWGEPNEDSDYDLFIVMDTKESRHPKRTIEILSKCHPGNISIDLLVRTPSEVEERLKKEDPFIKKIMEEGKILYDESRK